MKDMSLSFGETLRIILARKNITLKSFAELLGTTQSNLTNKLKRDNFSESDMRKIADALHMDLVIALQDPFDIH